MQKVRQLMERFGFRNKEVIIEEEDPSAIQMTTQMSTQKLSTDYNQSCVHFSWKLTKKAKNSALATSFQGSRRKLTRNALPPKAKTTEVNQINSSSAMATAKKLKKDRLS